MSASKVFAPDFPRNDKNWIIFGRGDKERKALWPKEHTLHPAKMPIPLYLAIMEFVSEPGDTILDIFGGVGTSALATLHGRKVILTEIEDKFADIAQQAYNSWAEPKENLLIIRGDNRRTLPLPCNHIITSPPYAQTMVGGKNTKLSKDLYGEQALGQYQNNYTNIGNLNSFIYSQEMDKVYNLAVESLPEGGTLTVILKDQYQGDKRIFHSVPCIKSMMKRGMDLFLWEKHLPISSGFANIQRSKGAKVVEDEDILFFRKIQ